MAYPPILTMSYPPIRTRNSKRQTKIVEEMGLRGISLDIVNARNWNEFTDYQYEPTDGNRYEMFYRLGYRHIRLVLFLGCFWINPTDPTYMPRYRNGGATADSSPYQIENPTFFDRLDTELNAIREAGLGCVFDMHTEEAKDAYGNVNEIAWGPRDVSTDTGVGLNGIAPDHTLTLSYDVIQNGIPTAWRGGGTGGVESPNLRTAILTDVTSELGRNRAGMAQLIEKVIEEIIIPHKRRGLTVWFEPVNEPQIGVSQTFASLGQLYKDILTPKSLTLLANARVPLVMDAFGNPNNHRPASTNNYGKLPWIPKVRARYPLVLIRNAHIYYPYEWTHNPGTGNGAKLAIDNYVNGPGTDKEPLVDRINLWINAESTSTLYIGEWGATMNHVADPLQAYEGADGDWRIEKVTYAQAFLEACAAKRVVNTVWAYYGWHTDLTGFSYMETQFADANDMTPPTEADIGVIA